MIRVMLVLLTVACLPNATFAQSKFVPNEAALRQTLEGVVASIATGNYSGAWKELKPVSVVPAAEFEVFEAQFASQVGTTLQRYGAPTGYEIVKDQKVGSSLVQMTFVVRYEKAPMRWLFIAYRAEKGWVVTDFKFDGNTSALF